MQDSFTFHPARTLGLIFHAAMVLIFGGGTVWGMWQAAQADIGPTYLLYLAPALLAVVAVPLLAYRVYALQSATYTLQRDGLRLRWGLRYEDIPMNAIVWVHPATDLTVPLPLPWLRWPGALLGIRRLPAAESTGAGAEVEFLAARTWGVVLIATPERIYAISPSNPQDFLEAFQRFTEMGSLTPLPARSVRPTFLLSQVWSARPAQLLLLAGFALWLALLVWISLAISARAQVHMGFQTDGAPGDLVPAVRLLLLPVTNLAFLVMDFLLGLLFFRRQDVRPLSYLLWGSGVLTALLFLLALFFMIRSG